MKDSGPTMRCLLHAMRTGRERGITFGRGGTRTTRRRVGTTRGVATSGGAPTTRCRVRWSGAMRWAGGIGCARLIHPIRVRGPCFDAVETRTWCALDTGFVEGIPCLSVIRTRVFASPLSSDYGKLGFSVQQFTACGAGLGFHVAVSSQHLLLHVSQANRFWTAVEEQTKRSGRLLGRGRAEMHRRIAVCRCEEPLHDTWKVVCSLESSSVLIVNLIRAGGGRII